MRGSVEREAAAAPSPPQKKQVRRRVHTRKPYQEKLLNMAEARREIVTALKLHRASKHPPPPPPPPPNFFSSPSYYNNNNCCCNTPPPPIYEQNVDFALPHQPLGLNLNLDDFIMTSPSSIYSPSTSPLPPAPAAEGFEFVGDHGVTSPFDDVMEEFPAWLNDTTTNYLPQQQLVVVLQDDFSNFQHPPALPCMDIEEIEGIDGDWLA